MKGGGDGGSNNLAAHEVTQEVMLQEEVNIFVLYCCRIKEQEGSIRNI